MRVGDFLKGSRQQLVTCKPNDSVKAAAERLYAHHIGAMPVCAGLHMVGIISERDLVRAFATRGRELLSMRVDALMTLRVVTCGPDALMEDAQAVMRANRFRHLPVVEGGRVLGILSIRDTLSTRLQESILEINVLRDAVVAARCR
jgi:CBS domain-containing protein